MYNGITVKIGEEEFIIPPISLGQLRNGLLKKLQEHDDFITAGKAYDAMQLRGDIILLALRRNYPDFPEEKLMDFLDLGNSAGIWVAILGASGLVGEAKAAKPNGTLDPSTEASPQPTAGPTSK